MADELRGRRVAIVIAQRGTEQVEFEEPKKAVEEAGASVDVVSDQIGEVQAVNNDLEPGDSFTVEKAFSEVSAEDYDALIVPGGAVGQMSSVAARRRWSSYAAASSGPSLKG